MKKTVRTTFSSRIFRSIVPWMAVLFLISFLFFFSYQSHVFINEKAGDIEVIIADRAEDFENRFREIKAEIAYVARFESVREALQNSVVFPVQENGKLMGYVQGNLNYERVIGMLRKSSRKNSVQGT